MGEVLVHFRTVVRAIRRHYQRVEQACGISGAQLWALAHVAESPGLRVGELAHALAIHQSTASNMLDKLESAGLLSRRRSDEDQRVVRLHVTARGRRVLARAPRPLRGVLQQGLHDLPEASLAALNRELATLVRAMHLRERAARKVLLEEDLRPQRR
jgi:DNA-binding MarR family transcriptional regulator